MSNATLAFILWKKLGSNSLGRWLYSKIICFKAPYFSTISPCIVDLEPGKCVATIKHKRKVTNHLGSIHAIALCNLAELVGGLMTDVSIPPEMRWIPKGMTVNYLQKAKGKLTAIAQTNPTDFRITDEGYPYQVNVEIKNAQDELVFTAMIEMWISPKQRKG
jgi:acyl-coenzyme A thioesterase PaaI-like protein